jgi:hypothetical protein
MTYEEVIENLKDILNKNNIIWGIGGSFLLKIYNLSSVANDLDLWVRPYDLQKVRNIFREYEEICSEINLPSDLHFKMNYLGTQVDFVAAFIIKPNQNTFDYEISPKDIKLQSYGDTDEIPLTSLEDWYFIYKLLKRNEKAAKIETFLIEHKFNINKILSESKKQNLPKYIKKDAKKMVKKFVSSLQLPLWENGDTWED